MGKAGTLTLVLRLRLILGLAENSYSNSGVVASN
jgi:hypothetical protein